MPCPLPLSTLVGVTIFRLSAQLECALWLSGKNVLALQKSITFTPVPYGKARAWAFSTSDRDKDPRFYRSLKAGKRNRKF